MNLLIGFLVFVALVIAGFVLAMKILKSTVKAGLTIVAILFALTLIWVLMLVNDYKDLMIDIKEKPSIVILQDGEDLVLVSKVDIDQMDDNNGNPFLPSDVMPSENYKHLYEEYFKILEVQEDFLINGMGDVITVEFDNEKYEIEKHTVLKVIHSNTPYAELVEVVGGPDLSTFERQYIEDELKAHEELKHIKYIALGLSFQSLIEEQGTMHVLDGYKKGSINIHPETILFKTGKNIPNTLLKRFIE